MQTLYDAARWDLLGISLAQWPALSGWVDRISERPSVAAEFEVVAAL